MSIRHRGQSAVILAGREVWVRQTAKHLGISPATLSRILNGAQDIETVRVGLVRRLSTLLEFPSIDAFLDAVTARQGSVPGTDALREDHDSTSRRGPSVSSSI